MKMTLKIGQKTKNFHFMAEIYTSNNGLRKGKKKGCTNQFCILRSNLFLFGHAPPKFIDYTIIFYSLKIKFLKKKKKETVLMNVSTLWHFKCTPSSKAFVIWDEFTSETSCGTFTSATLLLLMLISLLPTISLTSLTAMPFASGPSGMFFGPSIFTTLCAAEDNEDCEARRILSNGLLLSSWFDKPTKEKFQINSQ